MRMEPAENTYASPERCRVRTTTGYPCGLNSFLPWSDDSPTVKRASSTCRGVGITHTRRSKSPFSPARSTGCLLAKPHRLAVKVYIARGRPRVRLARSVDTCTAPCEEPLRLARPRGCVPVLRILNFRRHSGLGESACRRADALCYGIPVRFITFGSVVRGSHPCGSGACFGACELSRPSASSSEGVPRTPSSPSCGARSSPWRRALGWDLRVL